MGLKSILRLGPSVADDSHPIHDLFPIEMSFFSSHGPITIDQVMILSNERCATEVPNRQTERLKDQFLCDPLFNASDEEF